MITLLAVVVASVAHAGTAQASVRTYFASPAPKIESLVPVLPQTALAVDPDVARQVRQAARQEVFFAEPSEANVEKLKLLSTAFTPHLGPIQAAEIAAVLPAREAKLPVPARSRLDVKMARIAEALKTGREPDLGAPLLAEGEYRAKGMIVDVRTHGDLLEVFADGGRKRHALLYVDPVTHEGFLQGDRTSRFKLIGSRMEKGRLRLTYARRGMLGLQKEITELELDPVTGRLKSIGARWTTLRKVDQMIETTPLKKTKR